MKTVEEYLQKAAECREMAESTPAHRQRLQEMAESWERLAELEKRHPTAENNNAIEFVFPPKNPKQK